MLVVEKLAEAQCYHILVLGNMIERDAGIDQNPPGLCLMLGGKPDPPVYRLRIILWRLHVHDTVLIYIILKDAL